MTATTTKARAHALSATSVHYPRTWVLPYGVSFRVADRSSTTQREVQAHFLATTLADEAERGALLDPPVVDHSEHARPSTVGVLVDVPDVGGYSVQWGSITLADHRRAKAGERPWTKLVKLGHSGELARPWAGAFRLLTTDGEHIADGLVPNSSGTGWAGTTKAATSRANGAKGGRPATCTCTTCTKCKARARKARSREQQQAERAAARIADPGVVGR